MALCAKCRAYDTRVRRGVLALQASGEIEVSAEFRRRLVARLRRERLTAALTAGPVRAAGRLAPPLLAERPPLAPAPRSRTPPPGAGKPADPPPPLPQTGAPGAVPL